MKKLWIIALCALVGCDRLNRETDELLPPQDTPPSYLSFRVEFPVKELEQGVNKVLPSVLFDDALPLKDESDTLYLRVKRKGNLVLNLKDDEVFAAIPLEIDAAIKKKVMGITLSNQDAPISFSGTLRASTQIELSESWDLNLNCQYRNFHMEGMSTFSFMGFSLNIEKMVQSALENHSDDLSNAICQGIRSGFNFREVVSKVYQDIQKPMAITQKPQRLFLHSLPSALNGQLVHTKRDTLSLHMEYRSALTITPKAIPGENRTLPNKEMPLNTDSKLLLYPDVRIPYADLSNLIGGLLANKIFNYEGYTIKIKSATVTPEGQKLQVIVDVSGDIEGVVKLSGVPVLNPDRSMSLSNFKYDLNLNDDLLNMADWVSHQFIEEYLSSQVQLDTQPFFENLDELIVSGIGKTPLSNKMKTDISFDNIQTYQFRCTEDFVQWIFVIEGAADLTLKEGLFNRK